MKSSLRVRIRVRGRFSKRLVPAFEGMRLVPGVRSTELVGEVADQAQLHGLLTRIRDLGLVLDAVRVNEDAPSEPPDE